MLSFPIDFDRLSTRLAPGAEPAYVESLQNKLHDTTEIVQTFVALRSQGLAGPYNEDLLRQCHEAVAEVRVGRSMTCADMTKRFVAVSPTRTTRTYGGSAP